MPRRKKTKETQEVLENQTENLEPEGEDSETEPVEIAAAEEETPEVEAEEAEQAEEKPAKRRQRRRRTTRPAISLESTSEPAPEEEAAETPVEDKNLETMTKQWILIRDISQGITGNLERVAAMVKDLPTQVTPAPVVPQASLVAKMSVGIGLIALVLSIVSMTLAQSARQTILTEQRARVEQNEASLALRQEAPRKQPSAHPRRK